MGNTINNTLEGMIPAFLTIAIGSTLLGSVCNSLRNEGLLQSNNINNDGKLKGSITMEDFKTGIRKYTKQTYLDYVKERIEIERLMGLR